MSKHKTMKKISMKTVLIVSILLCLSCNVGVITPTAEIADPSLPEIAMMRADPHWGTVVIYNPDICEEIGEACGFFRLHAFAHAHLNHTLLASPQNYPTSIEAEADCWAAKYGKINEVSAVVKLFLDKDRNPSWKIHGDPIKRAEKIRACAMQTGKWSE